MMLGRIAGRIRKGAQYVDKKEELDAIGFSYDKQVDPNATGWEVVKAALLAYKEREGDLLVPTKFIVPRGDPETWPESTWGVKLGSIVNNIRLKGYYKNHHQELIEMGFLHDQTADMKSLAHQSA